MTIHIACASSPEYAPHGAAMLHSALSHTGDQDVVVHYIRSPGFPAELTAGVRATVESAGAGIRFADVTPTLAETLPTRRWLAPEAWYRLLMPTLVEADRALWLDVDAIVLDDLVPLTETELGDAYLAATEDLLASPQSERHVRMLGLGETGYFNSGVMVVDLAAMRRDGKDIELVEEARRLAPWLPWGDQDALNVVLGARRVRLHPRWNVTPYVLDPRLAVLHHDAKSAEEARARPAIRHFLGPVKPWSEGKRPKDSDLYWEHRRVCGLPG